MAMNIVMVHFKEIKSETMKQTIHRMEEDTKLQVKRSYDSQSKKWIIGEKNKQTNKQISLSI